jgi:hypothetical protein
MKKRDHTFLCLTGMMLATALILTGCAAGNLVKKTEEIDKSTRIITYTEVRAEINYSTYELEYIKDQQMFKVWFSQNLRPSLDYLKSRSSPSDKVLTWWDNGHLIRGYARREPIVYSPSYDLLDTVAGGKWDEEKLGTFSSTDDLTNVAYALLADSPKITQGIMKKYNAEWVYVTRADMKKIGGMVQLLDEDLESYLDDIGAPKQDVLHKALFRMADGWTVPGFAKEYEDEYATVYRLG